MIGGRLPPRRPATIGRVKTRTIVILSTVGALLAGGLIIGAVAPDTFPTGGAPTEQVGAAPFDQAGFDAYWSNGIIPGSRGHVTSVEWSGGVLSARTKLSATPDAVEPATTICNALATYWLQAGKDFQPVRVLDGAGQVLVSKNAAGDTCKWRR